MPNDQSLSVSFRRNDGHRERIPLKDCTLAEAVSAVERIFSISERLYTEALTYLGQSSFGPATGFSQPTPLITSTDGGITPVIDLSNPFPTSLYPAGLLTPIGSSLGLATNLGQAVTAQYLVACRSNIVTTNATTDIGVFPTNRVGVG